MGLVDGNGDGRLDIMTAAGPGGGPHVRVLDGTTLAPLQGFFAYHPAFVGGVFVTGGKMSGQAGAPQFAAGGEITAAAGLPSLTMDQLRPILNEAVARWSAAGDPFAVRRLNEVDVRIADLPGAHLGLATPGVIYLDVNAAGHGWFVDATPSLDEEFDDSTASSPARDSIDLLSTVLHELGHAMGLGDLDPVLHPDEVMAGTLDKGVRRSPGIQAVDSVFDSGDWQ